MQVYAPPIRAAGSFLPGLTGVLQQIQTQRNGLGVSNRHDLQDATQTDLVEDEMGQQGSRLWEPSRTSLAFSQQFHQDRQNPILPSTHTASFINLLARSSVNVFIGQTKIKIPLQIYETVSDIHHSIKGKA